ncbi:MAG: hypothetical protein RLZZ336_314 [Cyanobacteriota bacterium]
MSTSSLLLAFLTFGAACASLWAWMLATVPEQRSHSRQ